MSTTIDVPDAVCEEVERVARREGRSETEGVAQALRQYAARSTRRSPAVYRRPVLIIKATR